MNIEYLNKQLNTPDKLSQEEEEFPLVSIITVVYNGEEFLEDTIQSVLNQDYKNIEYIIIDGGSTDDTLDIIKKYENNLAYWVSEPDNGIYDAMNKGILRSTGVLLGIINADDYYLPSAINIVVNKMQSSNAEIFYGKLNIIDRDTSAHIKELKIRKDWKLYLRMSLAHPATFVKRKIYEENLYPTKYKIAGDYYLLLKAKLNRNKFESVNTLLVNMRDGGVSHTEKSLVRAETQAVKRELLGFYRFYLIKFLMLTISTIKKLKRKFT